MIEKLVNLLVLIYTSVRESGYFELVDMIRAKLAEMDIILQDGQDSTTWTWK